MIKVLVNGAKGRMGTEAVSAVRSDSELLLVAETDKGDDLQRAISDSGAQVVVDFTLASVGFENAKIILSSGARPVLGTSGFNAQSVQVLDSMARELGLGGIVAPNFAIGAVLLMKFAKEAVKYFPNVEIVELHHDKKEDFPSGTAVRTAEMISEGRALRTSETHSPVSEQHRDQNRGVVHSGVTIHSVRLPGYVAHEEVLFGGQSQTLSIRHDSIHRQSFMPGVVLSCKKVMSLSGIVYGLEHIL
ncbi:MAG TPA: 4-hydroxy-tetrahydrodipicolinate reductase [Oligoflexia bacterium]|nr:4-hydroxy-tetrahydrodipicolinate reductase [Oligoflexia bacterium]HMP47120.1 4-hydroxy-tetrahydrodipicolinate reductase [Oligoflexia bacterium]